jgi:murein DD-endopeptidase MepM/ murein hydrolase activator NlpD
MIALLRHLLALSVILAALAIVAWLAMPALWSPIEMVRLAWMPAPGVLAVPVAGVERRQIADTWGGPRSGGRKHEGVDIFAPRGTPVRSTTRGVVLRMGENRLGGLHASVLGPGLQVHYYAHFDRFADFDAGDVVAPGDVLGYVGDTGNAKGTPPHLHYGIYTPSTGAVNPWPLLSDQVDATRPATISLPARPAARTSPS